MNFIFRSNDYELNIQKLSDIKLNCEGMSPLLSKTEFIPPKISDGKPIVFIEKQFGPNLTQEAIDVFDKNILILNFLIKGTHKI